MQRHAGRLGRVLIFVSLLTIVLQTQTFYSTGQGNGSSLIRDASGQPLTLRGASIWYRWNYADEAHNFNPLSYPEENFAKYQFLRDQGANFLRVQLNKWLWDTSPNYVRAVDTLVSWCEELGIMVDLNFQVYADMKTYYTWTKLEQMNYIINGTMQQFMVELASRYSNRPNVIGFEIMPERPSSLVWASLRNLTEGQATAEYSRYIDLAVRAIHQVSPNYIVFVYPGRNDRFLTFVKNYTVKQPNVVYVTMRSVSWDRGYWDYADAYYSGNPEKGAALMEAFYKTRVFAAIDLGYPVMLLETEVLSDLPNPARYVDDLLRMLNKYNVGFAWWSFDMQSHGESIPPIYWLMLLKYMPNGKPVLTDVGLTWARNLKSP